MSIGLGPGTLYIDDTPLGACYEIEEVWELEPPQEWPKDNPFIRLNNSGERSVEISVAFRGSFKDTLALMYGITDWVLDNCPSRRVVHLAKHGKKRKTRKKNIHRAFRIMEGKLCNLTSHL